MLNSTDYHSNVNRCIYLIDMKYLYAITVLFLHLVNMNAVTCALECHLNFSNIDILRNFLQVHPAMPLQMSSP